MKNCRELRKKLATVCTELHTGNLTPNIAKEINNAARNMISSANTEMVHCKLRGEKPDIKFLQ